MDVLYLLPRGTTRLIDDALATTDRMHGMTGTRARLRANSAFCCLAPIRKDGADVSVAVRMDPRVEKAIVTIEHKALQALPTADAPGPRRSG